MASSHWPLWFERLAIHQDYVWFVVLLGWGFTALLWWRRAAREAAWSWVPWVAGAGALGAAVQFGIFNPHLDIFQSRLKPGTIRDYVPAVIDVELLGDWLLAALVAGWTIAWSWLALGERAIVARGAVAALVIAAASAHVAFPTVGSTTLAGGVLLAALALGRGRSRVTRFALLAAAAAPLFSTIGPLACAAGQMQRVGPPTAFGLVAAIYQCAASSVVFLVLRRECPARSTADKRIHRGWWLVAACWLAGGLWFAQQVGRDNRHELHQNRLRGAAARAQILNADVLERWAQPLPPLWQRAATDEATLPIPRRIEQLTETLSLLVAREFRYTPFIERVRIVTVNSGWMFVLADSRRRLPDGVVEVVRRATPQDEADWTAARNLIEVSAVPEIGRPYLCRAAMHAGDGRMLGWLEFEQREFFQSIERKWRSGPLLVTALGLLLGATLVLQRRVERERELAERDAAVQAEASRVKSAFLATVSHELRTPLQSLLGYGELVRGRLAGDAQVEAWLDAMQQHGELMTRLVDDLIDLGAVDAGTLRLAPRVVAPSQLVLSVAEGLRSRAEAKGLRLQCTIDESVPAAVLLDDARWRQVVFNLVGNAVKFTDYGAVAIKLQAEPRGARATALTLTVTDTGPGIAPAAQRSLFQAFARLERTAHKEGAGIGLALSAALCRALGGELTVESDGVNGSTFRATVVGEPSAQLVAAARAAPRSLAGQHVLIVDDNTLVRELFAAMLTAAGARCALAATTAGALLAAEDRSIDVAVLDLALGTESGIELAAKLRARRPELRLIGASAHAGAAEREAALRAGCAAFLTKPVSQNDLLAAVSGTSGTSVAAESALPAWQEELARQFRQEAPQNRRALADAVAAREWRGARGAAHYLANSAAAIGDGALRNACEALVRAAEQQDDAGLRAGWVAVEAALGRWVQEK